MNKSLFTILFALFAGAFLAVTPLTHAQTPAGQCQPIYGGGESCGQQGVVNIDSTVKNPAGTNYVNNLGANDPKYGPDQSVSFKLTVQNTGNQAVSNVEVNDTLPQYVDYQSGSGQFDAGSHTFSFTIDKLNPNESKVFFVVGKVVSKNNLPANQNVVCVINRANATVNNNNSQDNSQFCIAKDVVNQPQPGAQQPGTNQQPGTTQQGSNQTGGANPSMTKGGIPVYSPAPVQTTPPTGPESLPLLGLLPTGILGYFLKKKAK